MLTKREHEILELLAYGNSGKFISLLLNISYETVKSHTKNLKRKLQAKNLCHLIAQAVLLGYLFRDQPILSQHHSNGINMTLDTTDLLEKRSLVR